MISEHALETIRSHVAGAFKAGTETFPHYTLHGAEHLQELDRLARLLGKAVGLKEQRLALLRLACIVHDYAMVEVPDPEREAELREEWDSELSFADLVRKTHQDEIAEVLSQPDKLAFISGALTDGGGQRLEDAVTIAKHHRFHPLDQAPEHLRDLCALMRIADELDIGDKRAPLPAYKALRPRMEPIARFHWLKHMTTRPIRNSDTFVVETRGERRVLKAIVATKATEETWRPLQDRIIQKLRKCLDEEGVNAVLAEFCNARIEVTGGEPSGLSGSSQFLAPTVTADLEELSATGFLDDSATPTSLASSKPEQETTQETPPPSAPVPATVEASRGATRRQEEFRIVAIRPETLPEVLCLAGRLTVIGNIFIPRKERHVGGVEEADSRIYVGPADCGKTRSAMEWITDLTEGRANQWVVLRTDMGSVPEQLENIVLDTSAYQANGYLVPQRAVLFLDDLPVHLPPPTPGFSRLDAIRTLFQWFAELPYFRERRLVGTIRTEDLTDVPDWPDQLPTLGRELELVGLAPIDQEGYTELWKGMSHGEISRSLAGGMESFSVDFSGEFLTEVEARQADPEAVATFMREIVSRKEKIKKLRRKAADRFSESAVETWRTETWPAIHEAYGTPARVFFTLARFLEAGLRPGSGFLTGLVPFWDFHEVFGPALCRRVGEGGENYLETLDQLGAAGHAVGKSGEWIRPKFDYVLQAPELPGVEVDRPSQEWFIEHSGDLRAELRKSLAQHVAAATGEALPEQAVTDAYFANGWGYGLAAIRRPVHEASGKVVLLSRALRCFRAAVEADPQLASAWHNLGVALGQARSKETDEQRKGELLDEEIAAYRRAVEADPKHASAWSNLGVALGQARSEETDEQRKGELLDEEIAAYRRAVEADPKHASAWSNLGVALGQARSEETDEQRKGELLDEEIAAYRRAVEADPKLASAWHNLGLALEEARGVESNEQRRTELLDEKIAAYRQAVEAEPKLAPAWSNLGVALGEARKEETDDLRRAEMLDERIAAYRTAVNAEPNLAQAWSNLGVALWVAWQEETETETERRAGLLDESIAASRSAVVADPSYAPAWVNLGVVLGQAREEETESTRRAELLDKALQAAQKAADLGAGRYNLACALALLGKKDHALRELEGCLARDETSKDWVRQDPDWESFRDDPDFKSLLE